MLACMIFLTLVRTGNAALVSTGNTIPVNHQVINDHLSPAGYGWLPLTLQLNLAHRDNQRQGQQSRGTAIGLHQ